MGRNVQNEMSRRGIGGELAIREPKRMISEKEKAVLEKLPQPEPEENKLLANLNRLKEFNALCEKSKDGKIGRKGEIRLKEIADWLRSHVITTLSLRGQSIPLQTKGKDISEVMDKFEKGVLWPQFKTVDVRQQWDAVRARMATIFKLPSEEPEKESEELKKAVENLRNLKSI